MSFNQENELINFHNWWEFNSVENEWFYKFIKNRRIKLLEKDIHFFSVFGQRELINYYFENKQTNKQTNKQINKQTKLIFFSGENVHSDVFPIFQTYRDYCLDLVDLSLGFDSLNIANYLRFPLWILYLVNPNWTYLQLKNYLDNINLASFRLNADRKRFACHISRHDGNGVRRYFIDWLNNIDNVICPGVFNNNTNELHLNYNNNKIEYLKNFKFNVCPENTSVDFYVTEKIFESIISGCIPIYWGGGKQEIEPGILNPEALLRHKGTNEQELFNKIKELHVRDDEYKEFIHIPPFCDSAADVIWNTLQELENHLKDL